MLASGGYKEVILWDARTGDRIRTLRGHEDDVNSVAFSPDGYTLASGHYGKTVILWDARTGVKLAWMPCRCPVLTCQFGEDHRLYAADDGRAIGNIPNIYIMEVMKPGAKTTDRKVRGSEEMAEFDVFLAHNSVDKDKVEAICEALRQKGLTPWLDKEQIPPGRWFQDVIQQAIATVKSAAIFIGEQGLGRWEALELRSFISQCVERGIPVIPVLLPGVERIPDELLFLKQLNLVRFKTVDDPEAIKNLYWGITGEHL